MAFTMFQACVPVCTQMLGALSGVIDKAAHIVKKYDVQRPCSATGCSSTCLLWLASYGRSPTSGETSRGDSPAWRYPNLSRGKTKASLRPKRLSINHLIWLEALRPQIERMEDKKISWTQGQRQIAFKGRVYLRFGWPNLFFHVITAYNILRRRGKKIGKRVFLGS